MAVFLVALVGGASGSQAERLSPDAILEITNLSPSTVANVQDDPDTPDANWIDAVADASDTILRTSFPSPSGNLQTGVGLQEFRILVRRSATGGTNPSVTVQLYEAGAAVTTLTNNSPVTSNTGQLISVTWDASSLSSVDGSAVELRIVGNASGGQATNRRSVDVGAIEWNATVAAANTAPTVTITAPPDASSFNEGVSVNFTGTATDAEDDDATLTAALAWASNLDSPPDIGTGGSFSNSTLSVGAHTITASVTDSGGLSDSNAISLTINNVTPTVTITSPADPSSFPSGTNITFSATATDPNDTGVEAGLSWTSSIDDVIGSGASFSTTTLSEGTHTITASVADPDGGPNGQDQITVTITGSNTAPTVTITAPPDASSFNEGVSVNFTGTATDAEDDDATLTAALAWASNLDSPPDIGSGGSFSNSTLSVGAHTITASVTDSGGLSDSAAISLTINNVLTAVSITAPADLSTFNEGDNITFTGTATDPNDTGVEAGLSWTSDLDSPPDIGTGGSFSRSDLSPGSHTITAEVNDPDDATLVQKTISITINAKPVVNITSPGNGADFLVGTPISFTGTATDAEDGTLTASLAWTSSLDSPPDIGTGGSFSNATLSVGTHTITASVTDSGGATGQAQITITVSPPGNTPPVVTITSPADSAVFTAGDPVNFAGTATDVEDGSLTASLSWTSSLQGLLGSGGSFSRNDLAIGTHVITAAATDSLGARSQDQVTITVNAPAAVNGTTAGTATAEASSCSQITVVARFTGDDDDDGSATFTISPSGTGCSAVRGASPRRCIISELTPGSFTLSVSFADPDGVSGSPVTPTGSPVTVPACNGTDDAAPTLLVLAPMRNAVVTGTDRAKIQVYDPNLSTVQWMVDSANDLDLAAASVNSNYDCGTDCSVYEFDIDTTGFGIGAHYFTVKATDSSGNVGRITRAFRVPTSPGDGRLLRRTRGSQLCIDCHNLPTHSSQTNDAGYGNWAIECVDCHTPHQTSNIYLLRGQIDTPNSGRRSVRFESRYGARKDTVDLPGQASFANEDAGTTGSTVDAVDGPCQVCHTRTRNPNDGKERWRNSGAGGNADNHFDDGRPTQICTLCHSHSGGFNPAGGVCNACHNAPPTVGKHNLHDEVWDSTAGNLPTNYAEDVTHATATQYGYACAECHSNALADHFPTEQEPYTVDVLFKGTAPSNPAPAGYTQDAGSLQTDRPNNEDRWYWSNGTCANLYCHSNAAPVGAGATTINPTVTWDQDTVTTPVTCASCHNTQGRTDSGSAAHLSTAHGKHIQSTAVETNTYSFKCDECHALTIRDNPNDPWNLTRAADFSTVAGRGKLQHVDGGKDVAFSATATAADSVDQSGGSYAGAGGSCSSTYCHSRGTTTTAPFTAPFASLNWVGGTSSCESCHGGNAGATNKMATNAHTAHMNQSGYLGKDFECAQCHDDTLDLASDTTIADRTFHVNGARNININQGGTYDGAFGCSSVYCHSNGTETLDYVNPPAWNSGSTLNNDCKQCHGTEGGSIAGEPRYANNTGSDDTRNTHPQHVRAAGDCVKCHSGTVDGLGKLLSAGSHLNQSRDVVTGGYIATYDEGNENCTTSCHVGAAASPQWGGGPYVCLDCHTGTEGGVLGDGAPNAVDDQWTTMGANSAGHGHASYGDFASTGGTDPSAYGGCDYCHDLSAAHAPTASVNPYRLRFSATDNTLCLKCHSVGDNGLSANSAGTPLNLRDSSKDILDATKTTTGHFGAKHQAGEGGGLCWDCHDPHGVPSNILMIKSVVSQGTTVDNSACVGAGDPWSCCTGAGTGSCSFGVPSSTVTVNFTDNTTPNQAVGRFTEASNSPRSGMCQACHAIKAGNPETDDTASTKWWRNDGTDFNTGGGNSVHNAAALCTQCHSHGANFAGSGGCLDCHNVERGSGATLRRPVVGDGTTTNDDFAKQSHHVGARWDADGATLHSNAQCTAAGVPWTCCSGAGAGTCDQTNMGGRLTNFDCVVCHSEGWVDTSGASPEVKTNSNYHGNDGGTKSIDLRNVDARAMTRNDTGDVFSYQKEGTCSVTTTTICRLNSDCPGGETCDGGMPYASGAAAWNSGNANWRSKTSTALDPFCMSCHDSLGATAANVGSYEGWATTGSATNPFGDTAITNEYDQLIRGAATGDSVGRVVNIKDMVAIASNSDCTATRTPHSCCTGAGTGTCDTTSSQFCTGSGTPWACCTGAGTGTCAGLPPDGIYARHAIRDGGVTGFDLAPSHNTEYTSSQGLPSICETDGAPKTGGWDFNEPCTTLYDQSLLTNAGVTPSGEGPLWNDTSVMGCADCHATDGSNGAVGNAHGTESEYLLKNANGATPTEPNGATASAREGNLADGSYICFKCHVPVGTYGSNTHTGGSSNNDFQHTANSVGSGRADLGGNAGGSFSGIACLNCHGGAAGNKGTHQVNGTPEQDIGGVGVNRIANFGRIHGNSSQFYIGDPPSGERRSYRFTNGGSLRYFDPMGWTAGGFRGTTMTCYTLGGAGQGKDNFGGCIQHGGSAVTGERNVGRALQY